MNKKIIIAICILLVIGIIGLLFAFKRDGSVSEWSEWSQCSKPCDSGTQMRTRTYIPPRLWGSHIIEKNLLKETRLCNKTKCSELSILVKTSILASNSMYTADLKFFTKKTIIESDNKLHRLILIPDGVYIESKLLNNNWTIRMLIGKNITKIHMNSNGNLEMLNNNDKIVWESNTMGNQEAYAELTNDGEFVIKNINNQIIKTILNKFSNKILSSDKFDNSIDLHIITSPNGKHFLALILEAGLIEIAYSPNASDSGLSIDDMRNEAKIKPRPSFMPKSNTFAPSNLIMNKDGNLELRNVKTNTLIWESQTSNNIGAYAELNDDGSFVIKNKNDQVIKTIINPV